jgi:hypothetical protein
MELIVLGAMLAISFGAGYGVRAYLGGRRRRFFH